MPDSSSTTAQGPEVGTTPPVVVYSDYQIPDDEIFVINEAQADDGATDDPRATPSSGCLQIAKKEGEQCVPE